MASKKKWLNAIFWVFVSNGITACSGHSVPEIPQIPGAAPSRGGIPTALTGSTVGIEPTDTGNNPASNTTSATVTTSTGPSGCTPSSKIIPESNSGDPDIGVDYSGFYSTPSGEGVRVGPPLYNSQNWQADTTPCDASNPFSSLSSLYNCENGPQNQIMGINPNLPWGVLQGYVPDTAFITSISYMGTDCNCYQSDMTGTYQITCRPELPALNGSSTPPGLADLPSGFDGAFNFINADAHTWHVAGDRTSEQEYGAPYEAIAGASEDGIPWYYYQGNVAHDPIPLGYYYPECVAHDQCAFSGTFGTPDGIISGSTL